MHWSGEQDRLNDEQVRLRRPLRRGDFTPCEVNYEQGWVG
jgi:hypothetical protein